MGKALKDAGDGPEESGEDKIEEPLFLVCPRCCHKVDPKEVRCPECGAIFHTSLIISLLRLYRLGSKYVGRGVNLLPPYIVDFTSFFKFLNVPAFLMTLVYSIFCPHHFYLRLGGIIRRSKALEFSKPYPYLLRPFPYLVSFLLILHVFRVLGVKYFEYMPNLSVLDFTLGIIVVSLLMPIISVGFLILITLLFFLVRILALILSPLRELQKLKMDPQILKVFFTKRFWKDYRWGELFPALLYYSINSIVLFSLTVLIIIMLLKLLMLALPALDSGSIPVILFIAGVGAVFFASLICIYFLILRPFLYAVVFRSGLKDLERNGFPDLIQ